jgi:hypothetical protein
MTNNNTFEDDYDEKSEIDENNQAKIDKQRNRLISKLASYNVTDLQTRVAFVLNHFPETRDSDIKLAIHYWKYFQPELVESGYIKLETLFKLDRETTITRSRAKIQNEYKLFLPSEEIKSSRRQLAKVEEEMQVLDKPSSTVVTIYADESGKMMVTLLLEVCLYSTSFQHRKLCCS